ncbi:hypothetical protein [Nitrosopumilus sp.]|uniref:hypothetical protein n=1 Tax=Nitrosopumilus sp. TaxID=2024843 RepID=UPI002628CF1B|nr:hypothetical protein [Nitrosopumilus sp.]
MNTRKIIIIVGICMFIVGLIMFYSIEVGETDPNLRLVKNTGTFVGLIGMGATLGGVILFLISRNEPQIKENYDT